MKSILILTVILTCAASLLVPVEAEAATVALKAQTQVAVAHVPIPSDASLTASECLREMGNPVPKAPARAPFLALGTKTWRHYLALKALYDTSMSMAIPPTVRPDNTASTRTLLFQILQEQRHTDLVESEIAVLLIRQEMGPKLARARTQALATAAAIH